MIRKILAWSLLLGLVPLCQAQQRYTANYSRTDESSQYHVFTSAMATPELRFALKQGTAPFAPTNGWGVYLAYGRTDSDPSMHFMYGTLVGSTAIIQAVSNDFPIPVDAWYSGLVLTSSVQSLTVRGLLTVRRSPEISSPGVLSKTYAVNGSEYGPFTGSFGSWPFVEEGSFTYAKYPTNTWVAGYLLASSDGGTTTYAVANNASLVGVAVTNVNSSDGSVVVVTNGAQRDLSITTYVANAIGGSGSLGNISNRVVILESGTSRWDAVTNKIDVGSVTGTYQTITAANTASQNLAAATASQITTASNGLQGVIDTKLSTNDAKALYYTTANTNNYQSGAQVATQIAGNANGFITSAAGWSGFAATTIVDTAGYAVDLSSGAGLISNSLPNNYSIYAITNAGSIYNNSYGNRYFGRNLSGGIVSNDSSSFGIEYSGANAGTVEFIGGAASKFIGTTAAGTTAKVTSVNSMNYAILLPSSTYANDGDFSLVLAYVDAGGAVQVTSGGAGSFTVGYGGINSNKHAVIVGPTLSRGSNTLSVAGRISTDTGYYGDVGGLTGTLTTAVSIPFKAGTNELVLVGAGNSNLTLAAAASLTNRVNGQGDVTSNQITRLNGLGDVVTNQIPRLNGVGDSVTNFYTWLSTGKVAWADFTNAFHSITATNFGAGIYSNILGTATFGETNSDYAIIINERAGTNNGSRVYGMEYFDAAGLSRTGALYITSASNLVYNSTGTAGPGGRTIYHSGNFTIASYQTINGFNSWATNAVKVYPTPPTSNTMPGTVGELRYDHTNIYLYNAVSSKWLRVAGTIEW